MNGDFTVAPNQSLQGSGKPPNYVVVRVAVAPGSSQAYRADLIAFRERIRTQSEALLPAALKNIVRGQTPTDLVVGQLELRDLTKRYEIRLRRETAAPIRALEWFVDEVEAARRASAIGGTPIFSSHQLRDAVSFVATRMTVAPVLDTDDPEKVFEAWRGLVKSASAAAGVPARTFEKDTNDVFSVSSGFDTWHHRLVTQRIAAARTANSNNDLVFISQTKAALRNFLNTIEESDPRLKLTTAERRSVLAKFRELFADEPGTLAPPQVTGSEQGQARALTEWLNNPQVAFDVGPDGAGGVRLRGGHLIPLLIQKADQRLAQLYQANPSGDVASPALYAEVLQPLINALQSNDPGFSTPEHKQALAFWLTQHSVENFGTDAQRWRQYFTAFGLYPRNIGGNITIIRGDGFRAALNTVQGFVNDLVSGYEQDASFALNAAQLRQRLVPIKNILRQYSGQPERKLLDVFTPIATIATEEQFNQLVDAHSGTTYFVTFRNGQLYSEQGEYFDPADIIDDFSRVASMTDSQREAHLWRAIRYVTWREADAESRREIADRLVGPQGITDFTPPDESIDSWRRWYFELKPAWNAQAGRYVRSPTPPIA